MLRDASLDDPDDLVPAPVDQLVHRGLLAGGNTPEPLHELGPQLGPVGGELLSPAFRSSCSLPSGSARTSSWKRDRQACDQRIIPDVEDQEHHQNA
jgi:hypothetical protein